MNECDDHRTETANIHLDLLGEQRIFQVTLPLGPRSVRDLLGPARELTMQATAVAVEHARTGGKLIQCKAGCGACCRQLVAISVVEATALADLVAALPMPQQVQIRGRFADAIGRLEAARMFDPLATKGQRALMVEGHIAQESIRRILGPQYFSLGIPCPFLEHESCSIHPDRPLVCREYHVASPAEDCARLYRVKVDSVQPPLHMSDVLARTAGRIAGIAPWTIPLVLSLEWAEANGERLGSRQDGWELFLAMLRDIDQECERPFDRRDLGDQSPE